MPLLVPDGVVTLTATVLLPTSFLGTVTVIEVGPLTVKMVAGSRPKATPVAPVKVVPVKVTTAPPLVEPISGDRAVIVGAGM